MVRKLRAFKTFVMCMRLCAENTRNAHYYLYHGRGAFVEIYNCIGPLAPRSVPFVFNIRALYMFLDEKTENGVEKKKEEIKT